MSFVSWWDSVAVRAAARAEIAHTRAFVFAFTLFVPLLALAQAAPSAGVAPQQPAPAPPRIVAGQDGFAIESGNGDFRLQFGVLLHADGRFALDDENEQVVDTFAARRVRPYLRGRIARRFEFYLNPDFAGSTLVIQDAYLDTIFAPAFRIRAGKAKAPFGFERLHPASNLLFFERALPNALVPNRDVGLQVLGDVAGGLVSYAGAVMNGVPDGASADVDTADSKDVVGRLIVRPFTRGAAAGPLRGVNLAFAASAGGATGTAPLPTLRTQMLQQAFFSYATTGGVVADGTRTRYSPQLWYFHRAFGGWVEYVRTDTPVRRGPVAGDISHDAWQVAASYVLTGEAATDAGTGVRPRANFDFGAGNWGAFQVAARYHTLAVDGQALALGVAAAGASRKAEAWTVGLNWYLTGNVRNVVNFERTVFDDDPDGPRRAENALAFRTQLSF
jgi:phosphate-selective porin OprO/OprP